MKHESKREAFSKAYAHCHAPFLRYCSAIAHGKMETEDLVQDVLLSAYENFDRIQKKDQLLHYLIRAARNRAINQWRRLKILSGLDRSGKAIASRNSQEILIDIQLLYAAIDRLPAKQKEAILLFEVSGFSIKEIAEIQGGSEGAVKTRLSRARQRLRQMLGEKQKRGFFFPFFVQSQEQNWLSPETFQAYLDQLVQPKIELGQEEAFQLLEHSSSMSAVGQTSLWKGHGGNQLLGGLVVDTALALLIGGITLNMAFAEVDKPQDVVIQEDSTIGLSTILPLTSTHQEMASSFELLEEEEADENISLTTHSIRATSSKVSAPQDVAVPGDVSTSSEHGQASPTSQRNPLPEKEPQSLEGDTLNEDDPKGIVLSCPDRDPLSDEDINALKNRLIKMALRDRVITTSKSKVRVTFNDDGVYVNRKLMNTAAQRRYEDMLEDYNIEPCPKLLIEAAPKYIAIGELTKKGFKGQLQGSLDLSELRFGAQ